MSGFGGIEIGEETNQRAHDVSENLFEKLQKMQQAIFEAAQGMVVDTKSSSKIEYELRVLLKAHEDTYDRINIIREERKLSEAEEAKQECLDRIHNWKSNIEMREKAFRQNQEPTAMPIVGPARDVPMRPYEG